MFVIKSKNSFVYAKMDLLDLNSQGTNMKFTVVSDINSTRQQYDENLPVLDLGTNSLNAFLKEPCGFNIFGKIVTNGPCLPFVANSKTHAVSDFRPRRKESPKSGKKSDKVRKNKRSVKKQRK